MDMSNIRKLVRLIEQSDITEIEISEGDSSVRISRQSNIAAAAPVAVAPAATAVASPVAATPASSPEVKQQAEDHEHAVCSPMVGTFYAAASPDAKDFVSLGDRVKKGDTLCIIEAMKLMNEIEAEYDGTIEEIFVKNANPVEYGQALFLIRP